MRVFVPEVLYASMEGHALSAYPEECCGLLVGELPADFGEPSGRVRVAEMRRLGNAWESRDRTHRYRVDPGEVARVEKECSGRPYGILGVYHSHPDLPARPSPFDLGQAWPSYAYLIFSVRKGRVEEARVWTLSEDREGFEEGSLEKVREESLADSRKGGI